MLVIRDISEADYDDLLRINAEGRPGVAALEKGVLVSLLSLPGCHLVAAAEDGTLLGYLIGFPCDADYDGEEFQHFRRILSIPFYYVDQIAVSERHRGRGVARELYSVLFNLGRSLGMRLTCCGVNTVPPNPVSLKFHRKLGFDQMDERPVSYGCTVAFLTKWHGQE